ncbi:MAG: Crp/Fnr family transcriptional regulator [Muribaculaceae bacterium]|nr:Crp/Fnr family transcriptional regulator [Muribaculaceae bacterium]
MDVTDDIKKLLYDELGFLPESIDLLLENGKVRHYSKSDVVIECGKRTDDVFIVKSGIMRFVDMNGDKERTFAFALPGTMFFSKHSFVMQMPSYYQVEACCATDLVVITRDDFWKAAETSHELALWMLRYSHGELFYQEYKNAAIYNGTAAERYCKMITDRPAIIENVSQKIIASYLGVSPEYLCKVKRDFLKKKNKK